MPERVLIRNPVQVSDQEAKRIDEIRNRRNGNFAKTVKAGGKSDFKTGILPWG